MFMREHTAAGVYFFGRLFSFSAFFTFSFSVFRFPPPPPRIASVSSERGKHTWVYLLTGLVFMFVHDRL